MEYQELCAMTIVAATAAAIVVAAAQHSSNCEWACACATYELNVSLQSNSRWRHFFSWRTQNSGSSSGNGNSNSNNNVIIAAVNKWLRWGKRKNTKTNVSLFGAYLCFGALTHIHVNTRACSVVGRWLGHTLPFDKQKNFGIKMINITTEIVSIPLIFNRIG